MYKYHRISCNSKGFNCALYIQNSVLLLLYYMLITACTYFVYILFQLCTETSFQKKKKKKKPPPPPTTTTTKSMFGTNIDNNLLDNHIADFSKKAPPSSKPFSHVTQNIREYK